MRTVGRTAKVSRIFATVELGRIAAVLSDETNLSVVSMSSMSVGLMVNFIALFVAYMLAKLFVCRRFDLVVLVVRVLGSTVSGNTRTLVQLTL